MQYYTKGQYHEAFEIFRQEAERGNPVAMNNLSVCYINGQGTEPDAAAAFRWMKAAAEKGYTDAYYPLAYKYATGTGTPTDRAQALLWGRKAAEIPGDYQANAEKMVKELETAPSSPQRVSLAVQYFQAGRLQEAFNIFREEAENGNILAMYNVSVCYESGKGTAPDANLAFHWVQKAANAGYSLAMNNLAVYYAKGIGTAPNPGEAFRWMKAAAEKGDTSAYYPLACKYFNGSGTAKDDTQALFWARKAAEISGGEQVDAQNLIKQIQAAPKTENRFALGLKYYQAGQFDQAFTIFKEEAEKGVPGAMCNLSICYSRGQGTAPDAVKSFSWMKAAAEKGASIAYYPLASKYVSGTGTDKDPAQALFWARKAAEVPGSFQAKAQDLIKRLESPSHSQTTDRVSQGVQLYRAQRYEEAFAIFKEEAEKGNASAMYNLSICYEKGQGTAADPKMAFCWVQKAANAGYSLAMNNLAVYYVNGVGTDPDQAEAFRWMKAAAESGYSGSYYALASKYFNGSGTPPDDAQALFWFRKAAENPGKHQQDAQQLVQKLQAPSGSPDRTALGLQYYQAERYEDAVAVLKEEAESGVANAMYNLSVCYLQGKGTAVDQEKSLYWMEKAAENDWKSAYSIVARRYMDGIGTPVDLDKAEFWAEKGSVKTENAMRDNCRILLDEIRSRKKGCSFQYSQSAAEDYQEGHRLFVEKKYDEALPLLERAGRAGHPDALYNLGAAYYFGQGVPVETNFAFRFLQQAAYRGHRGAVRALALNFKGSISTMVWKMYAQYYQMPGCADVYNTALRSRNHELRTQTPDQRLGPVSDSARDAMINAVRNHVHPPRMTTNNAAQQKDVWDASYYYFNAAAYGNMDGLCGYAKLVEPLKGEKYKQSRLNYLRLAAYMGHSYAMYQMGQFYEYEAENFDAAKQCYQIAARWGYGPAVLWCKRNDG